VYFQNKEEKKKLKIKKNILKKKEDKKLR